jgi:cell division protein FtsL
MQLIILIIAWRLAFLLIMIIVIISVIINILYLKGELVYDF